MNVSVADLFMGKTWAVHGDALREFAAHVDSTIRVFAGLGPVHKGIAAAFGENTIVPDINAAGVARIELVGMALTRVPHWAHFMGIQAFSLTDAKATVEALTADPAVKSLTVAIDSPGGSIAGTPELAAALDAFQATGRPVHVLASGLLASAALWLAAGADTITASPGTLVGSIGAMVVLEDSTAADAAAGFKYTTVATGAHKGLGADGRVTPEQVAMAQAVVDAHGAQFLATLAAGRGLSPEAAKALATGDVWLASAALAKGLIDHVGTVPPLSGADPTNQPTAIPDAAGAEGTAMTMKILPAALIALVAAYPSDAAAITTEAMNGADESSLARNAAGRALAATVKAKDDQIVALTKDVTDARAATDAEKAEHVKTKATLATTQAELAKVRGIVPKHTDVGDDKTDANKPAPKTKAEVAAMEPLAKAKFFAAGGAIAEA